MDFQAAEEALDLDFRARTAEITIIFSHKAGWLFFRICSSHKTSLLSSTLKKMLRCVALRLIELIDEGISRGYD